MQDAHPLPDGRLNGPNLQGGVELVGRAGRDCRVIISRSGDTNGNTGNDDNTADHGRPGRNCSRPKDRQPLNGFIEGASLNRVTSRNPELGGVRNIRRHSVEIIQLCARCWHTCLLQSLNSIRQRGSSREIQDRNNGQTRNEQSGAD